MTFAVRRIRADEGPVLRAIRLAALADAPGDATTTLARAEARGEGHWAEAAAANASGALQATFFAELVGDDGEPAGESPIGLIGAYANETGIVNLVGLWSAPGHRDVGLASALLAAVDDWARSIGGDRVRIWVVERNEYSIEFYRREGFEPTGATIPYELDPRLRQVAMVRHL